MCVQIFIKIGWVVSEKLALQKRLGPGRAGSGRVGPGRAGPGHLDFFVDSC